MTRTVATHLHTINPTKHAPFCTQCSDDGSQKESPSRFLGACPEFHHTRIEAHNHVGFLQPVRRVRTFSRLRSLVSLPHASPCKHCVIRWSLSHKRLRLGIQRWKYYEIDLLSAAVVLWSGWQVSGSDAEAAWVAQSGQHSQTQNFPKLEKLLQGIWQLISWENLVFLSENCSLASCVQTIWHTLWTPRLPIVGPIAI